MKKTLFESRFDMLEVWLRDLDDPTNEQIMRLKDLRDWMTRILDREYVRNAA